MSACDLSIMNRRNNSNRRSNLQTRKIGNVLRKHQLTTQPSWQLSKSNRHRFPPPLVNDVSYVRKVRFYVTDAKELVITPTTINAQIFGSGTPFATLMITSIEAWGPTTSQITISPSVFTVQGSTAGSKVFSSVGAFASSPSHLKITIAEKDATFVLTTGAQSLASVTYITPVTVIAGDSQLIVDVIAKFSGNVDQELTNQQDLDDLKNLDIGK